MLCNDFDGWHCSLVANLFSNDYLALSTSFFAFFSAFKHAGCFALLKRLLRDGETVSKPQRNDGESTAKRRRNKCATTVKGRREDGETKAIRANDGETTAKRRQNDAEVTAKPVPY